MASIDLDRLRTQARIAYEWARIRDALLGIVPAVALVALTLCVAERPSSSLAFGSLMIVMSGAMLWYGRAPQRAVLPGIAAGLLPLVMALCANQVHSCGPDGCTSWCVPACSLGGLVAGLAIGNVGRAKGGGAAFWLSASGLALTTGAMGCSCIGYSGVIGLGLGFGGGLVPELFRRIFGRAR